MDDVNVLLETLRAAVRQLGEFLPRVLLAAAILLAGWLLAKAVRFAVVRTLRALNFGVVTEKAGVDEFLRQGASGVDTLRVLGALFYWLVILAAVMVAFNSLGLAYATDLVARAVLFVPRLMIALVIVVFGAYFARFVAAALASQLRDLGAAEAGFVARLAQYALMTFVVIVSIDQLGLGDIVRQTFLIILAAVALGLALAFGLGGRRRAEDLIERWTRGRRRDRDAPPPGPVL